MYYTPAPIPANTPAITDFTIRKIATPTTINNGRYLSPLIGDPEDIADIMRLANPVMIIIATIENVLY